MSQKISLFNLYPIFIPVIPIYIAPNYRDLNALPGILIKPGLLVSP